MTTQSDTPTATTKRSWIWGHWPALIGVAFAALITFDLVRGVELAPVLAASAVVYLGAAALQRPMAAWPMFFAAAMIITAAKLLDNRFDPTWAVLALGGCLLIYGLVTRALRPAYGFPLQTLALVGFGSAAAIALVVEPDLGAYLVAGGLLGHTAWDVYHYRVNRVVVRSMAEFCMFLDTALAVTIVVLTSGAG